MLAAGRLEQTAEAGSVLRVLGRALRQELHHLGRRPDLTWQQLHNRLQWDDGAITDRLATELRRRSGPGDEPWFRLRTRLPSSSGALMVIEAHDRGVTACAVSPDGSYLVSAGAAPSGSHSPDDGLIRVWDTTSGQERQVLVGHEGAVLDFAVSPDGSLIVSAGRDETVRLWDPGSGQQVGVLEGHDGCVGACAFTPDGAAVLTAGEDGTLRTWEAATGAPERTIAHTVTDFAVSPDGSFVIAADENMVRLWDLVTGEEIRSWTVSPRRPVQARQGNTLDLSLVGKYVVDPVRGCAVSPDGSFVVTAAEVTEGNADEPVRVWDTASGAERCSLTGQRLGATACGVTADGRLVVGAAGREQTLHVWDVATGDRLWDLTGHTGEVTDCATSADGGFVVSASSDGTLRLWDLGSGPDLGADRHRGGVNDCAVSPDGSFVVTASDDQTLVLWDAQHGRRQRTLTGHHLTAAQEEQALAGLGLATDPSGWEREWRREQMAATVNGCAMSPDGSFVVSAAGDGTVKLWDPATGTERHTLHGKGNWVFTDCAVSPDASCVLAALSDGTIWLWNAESGRKIRTFDGTGPLAVSPDGTYVAHLGAGGIRLSDPRSGRCVRSFDGRGPVAVSPDGSFVVHGTVGGLALTDPVSGQPISILATDGPAAVTPDGGHVLSTSGSTLELWDVRTGGRVASLPLPRVLTCVAVGPAGRPIVCGDAHGYLHLLEPGTDLGPPLVTAVGRRRPEVRCPACATLSPCQEERLGRDRTCPDPSCGSRMRVNPFVARSPFARRR